MANTVYPNVVLESKLNDNLVSGIQVKGLMTLDNSLTESAGMIKKINRYSYTGAVEQLQAGEGNTTRGSLSFSPIQYEVKLAQQAFDYTDEDFMIDPNVVEFGVRGASNVMANSLIADFFTEAAKATLKATYATTFSYDAVVDAIALMNLESESGLFLLIGPDLKKAVRKDTDFMSVQLGQIVLDGQIGTISGVPVAVSKAVPAGVAYLATKEAITLFTKKDAEVEQDRNADTRTNSIYMRKVNLVALTDATKIVKIEKGA